MAAHNKAMDDEHGSFVSAIRSHNPQKAALAMVKGWAMPNAVAALSSLADFADRFVRKKRLSRFKV